MFSEIHAHIHAHELARTHISIVLIRFTYFSSPLLCCVLIDFYRCLLCCPLGSYMPINIGELEIEGRMTEISFVCNSCSFIYATEYGVDMVRTPKNEVEQNKCIFFQSELFFEPRNSKQNSGYFFNFLNSFEKIHIHNQRTNVTL